MKIHRKIVKKLVNKIYLADWFDPIYKLIRIPFRIYRNIDKFIYYGYNGTKCVDFDASSIHTLIYVHMKRVKKFMNSSNTHLMWSDDPNTKDMRKLAEFTELSRRMSEYELENHYFLGKVLRKYDAHGKSFFDRINDPEYKKEAKIAIKKDRMKNEQLTRRYYYLLEQKVPGFWD